MEMSEGGREEGRTRGMSGRFSPVALGSHPGGLRPVAFLGHNPVGRVPQWRFATIVATAVCDEKRTPSPDQGSGSWQDSSAICDGQSALATARRAAAEEEEQPRSLSEPDQGSGRAGLGSWAAARCARFEGQSARIVPASPRCGTAVLSAASQCSCGFVCCGWLSSGGSVVVLRRCGPGARLTPSHGPQLRRSSRSSSELGQGRTAMSIRSQRRPREEGQSAGFELDQYPQGCRERSLDLGI